MKIALVSEHASPLAIPGGVDAGGQNVHVAALAVGAARLGHDVTVFTRRDDPKLPPRVAMAPGATVVHVDAGPARPIARDRIYQHLDRFSDALRRAWQRERPDIVHSHFWMSGVASLEASRATGVPVAHTFHALGSEKRRHQGTADTSPTARILQERRIARGVDGVIATSSAEAFELARMGASARTLRVVPRGVDLSAFSPDGPSEPRRNSRMRIVTLSRLVPRKGIADVIEALVLLPDAELIVAGGGDAPELVDHPEAKRLSRLARHLGVANRVYLRGRVERGAVPALLRSADVVVCAPWYEPFGTVPLEAMACGVPVVVSAVGGLVDAVLDGVTGLHVPAQAPVQLAAALETLRSDGPLRRRLGHAGVARARALYSWDGVVAETLDIYRSIASASGAAQVALGT